MASDDRTGPGDPTGDEDPIAYFLQDMEYHGKTERTREEYGRVLNRFERFLADRPDSQRVDLSGATYRDCTAWIHSLRSEVSDGTVATYAAYLHRFYAYMTQVGVFDANPMALVVEEMDEQVNTNPTRRDIDLPSMRQFMKDVSHPLDRAVIVTLLKTGLRVGELCNLDLRDLSLSVDLDGYDLNGRPQLDGRPRSLFVDTAPTRGSIVNGERRTASNKRKRTTIVPIDEELEDALCQWLAIRPDTLSPAEPLFVTTGDNWGQRLTTDGVRHVVESHAREAGWYHTGGGASENVTPHYFRHFFTTHLRDRTGDRGIVKYLRGDVGDDVIETYTHNWGDRVREVYEENIYQLFVDTTGR